MAARKGKPSHECAMLEMATSSRIEQAHLDQASPYPTMSTTSAYMVASLLEKVPYITSSVSLDSTAQSCLQDVEQRYRLSVYGSQ